MCIRDRHLQSLDSVHPTIIENILDYVNKYTSDKTYSTYITQNKKFLNLANKRHSKINIEHKHKFYTRISNQTFDI